MRHLCALYLLACRRWGPGGMTLSAYAWKVQSRWVRVIDAGAVLFRNEYHHCEAQYRNETSKEGASDGR